MATKHNGLADQFLDEQTLALKVVDLLERGSESVQVEAIGFLSALKSANDSAKALEFYVQNNVLQTFFNILQSS